jgi:hypothetical protein
VRVRGLGAPRVRAAPIGDPSGGHASGGVRDRALRGRGVLCPLFLLLSSTSPPPPPRPSPISAIRTETRYLRKSMRVVLIW